MVGPHRVRTGADAVEPEGTERVGDRLAAEISDTNVCAGERRCARLSYTEPTMVRGTLGPGVARSRTTEALPPTSTYPASIALFVLRPMVPKRGMRTVHAETIHAPDAKWLNVTDPPIESAGAGSAMRTYSKSTRRSSLVALSSQMSPRISGRVSRSRGRNARATWVPAESRRTLDEMLIQWRRLDPSDKRTASSGA